MATEFITQMQFVSAIPGPLQINGVQPVALLFASTLSPLTVTVNTTMDDPLAMLTGISYLRMDDTNPNEVIPPLGTTVVESTAPVVTETVEQPGIPNAQ